MLVGHNAYPYNLRTSIERREMKSYLYTCTTDIFLLVNFLIITLIICSEDYK